VEEEERRRRSERSRSRVSSRDCLPPSPSLPFSLTIFKLYLFLAPAVFISRPTLKEASSDEDYGAKGHRKGGGKAKRFADPDEDERRASFGGGGGGGRVNYNEKDVSYGIESEEEEMGTWQASAADAGKSRRGER